MRAVVGQRRQIRASGCASECELSVRVIVFRIRLRTGSCFVVRRHDVVVMIDQLRSVPRVRFVLAFVVTTLFGCRIILQSEESQEKECQMDSRTQTFCCTFSPVMR